MTFKIFSKKSLVNDKIKIKKKFSARKLLAFGTVLPLLCSLFTYNALAATTSVTYNGTITPPAKQNEYSLTTGSGSVNATLKSRSTNLIVTIQDSSGVTIGSIDSNGDQRKGASFTFNATPNRYKYLVSTKQDTTRTVKYSLTIKYPLADSTKPAVAITSPVTGNTLSGTVNFSASATDDVAVKKVEFYAGDTLLATDTASPYTTSWNTTTFANGPATLSVKAYDETGNMSTASQTVTVNNQVIVTPPPTDCDSIPMTTPIGALPPAMPMFCDHLLTGVASTFINGANSWFDDFNHGASMAELGAGYVRFEKSSLETGESATFRHNNHWMVDVYAPGGNVGGSQMRPDRSFRFNNGKLVVETEVAADIVGYSGFAWPEITITTASSPASQQYGPTPARSIGDDLYAYGQFGGYDTVGIRLHHRQPITAYYDSTERGFPCGRKFEISWFQDGQNPEGAPDCVVKQKQFNIYGGGEWMNPPEGGGWRQCTNQDPDTFCRDLFRWELTKTSLTLYVNGVKYMEHTALPGFGLPDAIVNGDVYVYFNDWVYQGPDQVVRFHWDRVAVNP